MDEIESVVYDTPAHSSSNIIALANNKRIQQTEEMNKGFLVITVITLLLLSAVFFFLAPVFDRTALHIGNIVMAVLSLASYTIITKQLSARPMAFVRSVSAASYLKILVCVIGILTYIMINRPDVHKPSIFMLMGIYAVYTIIETIFVQRLARKTK